MHLLGNALHVLYFPLLAAASKPMVKLTLPLVSLKVSDSKNMYADDYWSSKDLKQSCKAKNEPVKPSETLNKPYESRLNPTKI